MGGMIAQTMAIEHPDRLRSLISVMSHNGGQGRLGDIPDAEAQEYLMTPAPTDRDAWIAFYANGSRILNGGKYAFDFDEAPGTGGPGCTTGASTRTA